MASSSPQFMGGELKGLNKIGRGKVREIFDLDDHLLLVVTDRISAYDVILNEGIPQKGRVLTQISRFWFEWMQREMGQAHHLVSANVDEMPDAVKAHRDALDGRASLVRKADPLPVEFIVRGYLAGSGWSEYKKSRSICGISLPEGLVESSRLPEPIMTPTTKATEGHDENMTYDEVVAQLGSDVARQATDAALRLYNAAHAFAEERGIILADTKMEFGIRDGQIVLIDEVFTPDSSRFWPKDRYEPGRSQESFDKQIVRDYLTSTGWDRNPPPPTLPEDVVSRTTEQYVTIFERLTGETLS